MTEYDAANADRRRVAAEAGAEAERQAKVSAENARQEAWATERQTLAFKHAEWRRHCEDTQTPHTQTAPLPLNAPDWFRVDTGVPVEHVSRDVTDAPVVALLGSHDLLGRPYASTPEPSPEESFKAQAKRAISALAL